MLIEAFPGQGGKKYDSPTPELNLLDETLEGHCKLLALNPLLKTPKFLYGNSYGLYAALVVGGVLTYVAARELARRRADLVRESEDQRHAKGESRTGMLSLIGPTTEIVEPFVHSLTRELGISITNYNGPAAHVVSGSLTALTEFQYRATSELGRFRAFLLEVEGAYHHKVRRTESQRYAKHLKEFDFKDPRLPLISSTRPRILTTGDGSRLELAEQMVQPVRLPQVVGLWLSNGISHMIESGPGSAVKKLAGRITGDKIKVWSLEEDSESIQNLILPPRAA